MENLILEHKPELFWENNEAKYYKFPQRIDGESLALKVSWIVGTLQLRSFMNEITNLMQVNLYKRAGLLEINYNEGKFISYLLIYLPGEVEDEVHLEPDKKVELQQQAISRYEREHQMINTYVSTFSAGRYMLIISCYSGTFYQNILFTT
jgi:hypothetical protein